MPTKLISSRIRRLVACFSLLCCLTCTASDASSDDKKLEMKGEPSLPCVPHYPGKVSMVFSFFTTNPDKSVRYFYKFNTPDSLDSSKGFYLSSFKAQPGWRVSEHATTLVAQSAKREVCSINFGAAATSGTQVTVTCTLPTN